MTNGRQHRLALSAGYKLHWYEIESVLGQGGFGITYLARDTNLDQQVAIKEFLPTDLAVRTHDSSVQALSDGHTDTFGWGLSRFITEAKTLAKFRHPNIVQVFTVFEENHTAYMVMEYVKGRTLEDALKFQKVEGEAEFKRIILAILDGLELIHNEGFIHRDIKPENIYLRSDGTPVLLDFGSARQTVGGKTRTLTALVSPGYAPYEQYDSSRQSEGKQGPWTDIYALGATLYRAVTGHGPPDAMQRVTAVVDGKDIYQPAVLAAKGSYSTAFLNAIDWALEFKREDRPQEIDEWRNALLGEHHRDAVTAVADISRAKSVEPPGTITPTTKSKKPSDTERIDTSPALELPVRKPEVKPARPEPQKAESGPKLGVMLAVFAVVILAALAGVVYWGDLIPLEKSDDASAPAAPEVATVEELLSPEETARRRSEEAKQKAELLQKQLEEQRTLAEAEAARFARLESARERSDRIAQLLLKAESDFEAGRLLRPADNNALSRFKEVLALDSENTDAKAGIERVVAGLVERAKNAMENRAFADAESYLAEADVVLSGTDLVANARKDLAQAKLARKEEQRRIAEAKQREAEEAAERKKTELRQARIRTLLALAEQDLKAGRLVSPRDNNALVRYREILEIEPSNAAAIIGVEAVVTGLLALVSEATSRKEFARADEYLKQAEAIDSTKESVLNSRVALTNARKTHEVEQQKHAEGERKRAEAAAKLKAEADKKREIQELLATAENDLKNLRLTSPRGANAFERYQRVLELDPDNPVAESGILNVAKKYLALQDNAIAQEDYDKARDYLDKAEQVLPGSELVETARSEYESKRAKYEQAKAEQEAIAATRREAERLAKAQAELERTKQELERIKQQKQQEEIARIERERQQKEQREQERLKQQQQQTQAAAASQQPSNAAPKTFDPNQRYMRCETGTGNVYEIGESGETWQALRDGQDIRMKIDFRTGVVSSDYGYEDCIARVYVNDESSNILTINFSDPTIRGGLTFNATNSSKCSISKKFAEMGLCSGNIGTR